MDILQTVLVAVIPAVMIYGVQRWMDRQFKEWDKRREEADDAKQRRHAEEKEWRDNITKRITDNTEKVGLVLALTIENTRADLIHKAHRYLDDLGKASTEEKESFYKQYTDYVAICKAADIENEFIDDLVKQVMNLPNRQEGK